MTSGMPASLSPAQISEIRSVMGRQWSQGLNSCCPIQMILGQVRPVCRRDKLKLSYAWPLASSGLPELRRRFKGRAAFGDAPALQAAAVVLDQLFKIGGFGE